MRIALRFAPVFLFAWLFASDAAASLPFSRSAVEQLVASPRAVRATVMSSWSAWEQGGAGYDQIFTTYILGASETLKGEATDSVITLRVIGGTVGDVTMWVEHAPSFASGQTAVFLFSEQTGSAFRSVDAALEIENEEVLIDGMRVRYQTLRKALRDRAALTPQSLESVLAGPPPAVGELRPADAEALSARAESLPEPEVSEIFDAPSVDHVRKVSDAPISANAITATIYNAWWPTTTDQDGDGYARSGRLQWDPDVSTHTGSLQIFCKVWYRAGSGAWTLLQTSPTKTITGTVSSDAMVLDVSGLPRNTYDWKIEIYRAGAGAPDYTRDAANDAQLNDMKMETAGEDTNTPSAAIADAWWTSAVDQDTDGYSRSAKLNVDVNASGNGTSALSVYLKVYSKLASASSWTLGTTTKTFNVSGTGKSDAVAVEVIGSAHNLYDWKVEAFVSGSQTASSHRDASSDSDMNDVKLETAAEDQPAAGPKITGISPAKASAGTNTQVTITGTGFGAKQGAGKVVFFDQFDGPVVSWSDTKIVVIVPASQSESANSGPVAVHTAGGKSNDFAFEVAFGYSGTRWDGTNPVAHYRTDKAFTQAQLDALKRATSSWASSAGMSFERDGETTIPHGIRRDQQSQIFLGSTAAHCGGAANACAACWRNTAGNRHAECDIVFEKGYVWSTAAKTPAGAYDLETIGVHELGHWLQLLDLYGTADSKKVMYGWNNGGPTETKRTPAADDIAGAKWIYGAPVAPLTLKNATVSPSSISTTQTFTIRYEIAAPAPASILLGARIRRSGTVSWISDPSREVGLSIIAGNSTQTRLFGVASGTTAGKYDLEASIWRDTNKSGKIDSGDEQLAVKTIAGAVQITGCTLKLGASSADVGAAAGSGSVAVTATPSSCTWSATSSASWLSVTSATGGIIKYKWTANTSASTRQATITISGVAYTVRQAAPAACTSFTLSPTQKSTSAAAGSETVTITGSPVACIGGAWTATPEVPWLTVSRTSGTGPGTVVVSWTKHTALQSRSGRVAIAGRKFSVSQAAPK